MGDMGRETLGVSACPGEATWHRSVRTELNGQDAALTPSFLFQASICRGLEKAGGESTLGGHHKATSCLMRPPAKSTRRKKDAGVTCDKTVRQPCQRWSRAARPPSHSQRWRLSPGSATEDEDGGPRRPGVDRRRAALRP